MSTRSRIGMTLPDGKIKSIYCHFDGYPEGVGKTLQKYYTDPEKIEALLNLGDISSLGQDYNEDISKGNWVAKTLEDFEKSQNITIAYKDRGEDSPARIDENLYEFTSKIGHCGEEYTYLYQEDYTGVYRWHYIETQYFQPLNIGEE